MNDIPAFLRELYSRALQYLFSFAENTAYQLILITGLLLLLVLANFFWQRGALRRARRTIKLVIGGWGTRGKSGTERKKAALMYALGYNVVSKVTGTEAMFVHGAPGLAPLDIFVYRPNDKSTIWEQSKLLRWSAKMGAEVFLWECMALHADYVRMLQHDWTRDDVSTLTNAVPDHENVQGPAGRNIPEVMTNFLPENTKVFTAEDQMLPILRQGAAKWGTEVHAIPWWESELLADDVMARFPYHVHPRNLALVIHLAHELGISRDFVLKEIAEWIVPDIGALRTTAITYRRRRLEFANGMSANDRMSCMSNWERLGYNVHSPEADANVWIVTVVNNRADRIPRSKEFAGIIVNDIVAHRHILIGTNIRGLRGYIEYALNQKLRQTSFITAEAAALAGQGKSDRLLAALQNRAEELLRNLKVEGRHQDSILAKVRAMAKGLGMDEAESWQLAGALDLEGDQAALEQELQTRLLKVSDDRTIVGEAVEQLRADLKHMRLVEEFFRKLESWSRQPQWTKKLAAAIETAWRTLVKTLFMDSLISVEDPKTPGDAIINLITKSTPPGFRIRLMGIQNIKGTGLDFAYRWIALDYVQHLIQRLNAEDFATRAAAAEAFSLHYDYGVLDAPPAIAALQAALSDPRNEDPELRAKLETTLQKAQLALQQRLKALSTATYGGRLQPLKTVIEYLVEYGDAKRRQRKAGRIMKDLFAGRVSHASAARLIQEMVKRQYGGWLGKSSLTP